MSAAGATTAERIGAAARHDPQLRVPARPRLRRGLVIDVRPDEVVVEGGPKRQLFRGRSATELLPRLVDRLDGRRTHAGLAEDLGVPEPTVFKVLSLLWTCGVVEEAAPAGPGLPEVSERLADYLSRIGDATGANAAWEQAAARLAAARIEVFGAPELAELVLGALEHPLQPVLGLGGAPSEGATLVLAVTTGEHDPVTARLADLCWSRGLPFVRLRLRGRTAQLGPYVDRTLSPCLPCLLAGELDDDRPGEPGDAALAAGLMARELFAMLSRTTAVPLPVHWREVDLDSLAARELSAATRPGCERCSIADGPVSDTVAAAVMFEAAVAMPPRAFVDLKAHQMHYKPSNLALQQSFKTWPVAPRTCLPAPDLERLAGGPEPGRRPRPDLDSLSLLLEVTAGVQDVTPERVVRWTASGGNIGSVAAYLVVRDVDGLAPGIYAYVAPEHALARLSTQLGGLADGPAVSLVLTGDFAKVAQKYSAFAVRIVLLDGGCAAASARAVADALGLALRVRERWDDLAVAAALRIDLVAEPITGVLDLEDA